MTSAATYPVGTIAKLLLLTERRVQQLTRTLRRPHGRWYGRIQA